MNKSVRRSPTTVNIYSDVCYVPPFLKHPPLLVFLPEQLVRFMNNCVRRSPTTVNIYSDVCYVPPFLKLKTSAVVGVPA